MHGGYITALGRPWHPDCFVCAECGRAIGQQRFMERKGKPYHAACYHRQFSPRCTRCGEPITAKSVEALGKNWHPRCFVCEAGGEPLRGRTFHERDGKPYCKKHYEELFGLRCSAGGELIGSNPHMEKNGQIYCEEHYWQRFGKRCAIGGEILKGVYVVNGWGEPFCEEHDAGLPKCFSCGRPICQRLTKGGVEYGDGRAMCNRCRPSAVDDVIAGQRILDEVRATLARLGMDIGAVATPLRLVDQEELGRRSDKPYITNPSGMACHVTLTENGRVIKREVEAILILHGLPGEHFAAIAAHELGHTFLFMNKFPELEPMVEEGLCKLAQYLWLGQQEGPEAPFRIVSMEESNNPIYGEGFRAARRGMERCSLPELLSHVRKYGRFP
jgi:hypothetical protein